jgi:competence protein ComEC
MRIDLLAGLPPRRDSKDVQRARLVLPALAFVAGIAGQERNVGFPLLLLAAAFVTIRRLPLVVRVTATTALACGVLVARVHGAPLVPASGHPQLFHGAVLDVASGQFDGSELTVRLDDGRHALVFIPGSAPETGEGLVFHGTFEPLDEARNPGEPSARDLGAERGIDGRILQARILRCEAVDSRDPSLWLPRARAWAARTLRRDLPEPDATILAGALWGEKGTLPPELRAEFQDTGTVHVLVTAGLHLGVIAWLGLVVLRLAGCGRISSSLAAIGLVWLYAIFTGGHVPSLRAATMLSFGLLARAAGRDALSWNALAAAAIVTAALRPASVVSLSFALSFSCVGSILLFAKTIVRELERFALPPFASEAIALTFATQIGTWPLTAAAFLVFAPYAALANLCVIPAVGVAMLAGLTELALSPLPMLAHLVANVEISLLDWIVGVVRMVAGLPGAHIVTTPPPAWTIVTYDVALLGAAVLLRLQSVGAAFAVVGMATVLCIWPPRAPDHVLRIVAIDVGQADALLIRTPSGRTFLVDAGGQLERGPQRDGASRAEAVGERIVVPFLIRQGIHHLDAILLSHPHGDHAGGIAPVLRTLGADAFADSGQDYPGHAYQDALGAARERRVPLLEPRAGDVWQTSDGVTFRFYAPSVPYFEGTRNDINNNSLVFALEFGSFRMLFTGDAGAEAERRLLGSGADLRATVLKVGHHGSAYSSTPEFLSAVGARAAIVSVGRRNLFGHPAAKTLDALRAAGATVYRTDRDGAVTVESDGSTFLIDPYLRSSAPMPKAVALSVHSR